MNLNQTITLSPDVISQEVSGETVLLDLESENYFGLDEVGTRIWQLIKEKGDLQDIYDTLLAEYEVEEERLLQDLTELLDEISQLGLVTLETIQGDVDWWKVPDLITVFADRAVRGEPSRPRGVENRHAGPVLLVLPRLADPFLARDIVGVVGQDQIRVRFQ